MAIAQHAGISQATIFKYFKTKDDLLQAILEPMIKNLLPEYREDFLADIPETTTLRQTVRFLIRDRYAFRAKQRGGHDFLHAGDDQL